MPAIRPIVSARAKYARNTGTRARPGAHIHQYDDEHVVLLQRGQHVAPARRGLADAEPEEREGDLRQHVLRHEQRGLGEHEAEGLRRHVAADEVQVRGPEPAGGEHVAALARAQHHAPHEARRSRPVHEPDDQHHHEEGLCRRDVERKDRAHREEQVQPGQREEQLRAPHHHRIHPAARRSRRGCRAASPGRARGRWRAVRRASEICAPCRRRENWSRPKPSVPRRKMRAGSSTPNRCGGAEQPAR